MSYIPIDELEVYKLAMEIGEEVWKVVVKWDKFSKDSVGSQFCEASDSIAANIAEGHGRFHYKENKNFCFYARGSLLETKTWLKKAVSRKLLDEETFSRINALLSKCHLKLNMYIKSIGSSGQQLKEPDVFYGNGEDIIDLPF
jgi:four helix bundle protein